MRELCPAAGRRHEWDRRVQTESNSGSCIRRDSLPFVKRTDPLAHGAGDDARVKGTVAPTIRTNASGTTNQGMPSPVCDRSARNPESHRQGAGTVRQGLARQRAAVRCSHRSRECPGALGFVACRTAPRFAAASVFRPCTAGQRRSFRPLARRSRRSRTEAVCVTFVEQTQRPIEPPHQRPPRVPRAHLDD
jgi:hypothetical protein